MKKILFLFVMMLPMVASAYDAQIDGIYYNLDSSSKIAVVTNYKSGFDNKNAYTGELVIPQKVVYNEVEYCVESIGNYAFVGCSALTSISIPESVTSIGKGAFHNCSGLTSIIIPNSVSTIGDETFANCSSLTSVTIGNSVTSIGKLAFNNCSGLTSVHISDLTAWCNISFGDFEANPLYDANYLYMNGIEIKDLVIPNSVTSIGDYAFFGCKGLTSITIPNSVTSIGRSAFYMCSGLTTVSIPNSVTSIGDYGFAYCSGLTSITIPNSVTSIGERAFWECISLTSLSVDKINTTYDSRDNCNAIIETNSNTLIVGCNNTIIPNSVTSIDNYAFNDFGGLTSVIIPNSVTSIGYRAFYGCYRLASVSIPESVSFILDEAFSFCNLIDVYCYSAGPPSGYDIFEGSYIEEGATLHVPAAFIGLYQTTEPWSRFGTIKAIEDDTPETVPQLFKLTYLIDGEVYKSFDVNKGDVITPLAVPTKTGYTFSGWSDIPSTMPAEDLTITGTFTLVTTNSQCANPTISIIDSKIVFDCATEGVKYNYSIAVSDTQSGSNSEITLPSAATYQISVYATKDGYKNSETVTKDIKLSVGKKGDVNGDGKVSITDAVSVVNIILNQSSESPAPARVAIVETENTTDPE